MQRLLNFLPVLLLAACQVDRATPPDGGAADEVTLPSSPSSSTPSTDPTDEVAPDVGSGGDLAASATPSVDTPSDPEPATTPSMTSPQTATLGAGCFWCVEAVLLQVDGVESVVSGYMGGQTDNPTYKDICTGTTGHAEVVQVTFDPKVLSYVELLDWFFRLHDPTTLNRQGADRGTQYRSAIFTHDDEQARVARDLIAKIEEAKIFDDPIVTEVTPSSTFYRAEAYHQNYYNQNTSQGYCRAVIRPKLEKLGLKY